VLKEKSRCVHVAFPRLFIVHICFRNWISLISIWLFRCL
jgi:hypothetical protein